MRALLLATCLALAPLTACTTIPAGPGEVANQTVLDEQAASSVELAYKAARIACEVAVDAGVIRGERATQFRDLNRRAYAAVLAVRTAYRAGNASGYASAISEARALVDQLLTLTGRNV